MRKVKLAELAANKRWAINGGPFGSKLVSKDYRDEGVPVIRGANLPDSSRFSDDNLVFVSEEKADELLANNAHPGDVIFTQRGTLGQVGLIPLDSPFERYVISQSQMKMTVDRSIADPRWLYYYFRQESIVETIKARAVTSGVPHINLGTLKDFEITLPDLKTQEATADCLTALDSQLGNNRKQISLLEEAARLIYTERFVRLRPSQLSTAISANWRLATLEEAVWINPKTPSEAGKEAPFVPMTALSQTGMVIEGVEQRAIGSGAKFQNGDTLLARITPCLENGKTGFVQFLDDENPVASGSTEFIVLRPRRVNPYWVYCLARTEHFREFAIRSMSGADGRQRVSTDSLAQYPVTIPPVEVLDDFEQAVGPMFEQIHTLTKQIAQLRQARDLLLPRLISGQLRL